METDLATVQVVVEVATVVLHKVHMGVEMKVFMVQVTVIMELLVDIVLVVVGDPILQQLQAVPVKDIQVNQSDVLFCNFFTFYLVGMDLLNLQGKSFQCPTSA